MGYWSKKSQNLETEGFSGRLRVDTSLQWVQGGCGGQIGEEVATAGVFFLRSVLISGLAAAASPGSSEGKFLVPTSDLQNQNLWELSLAIRI